MRLNNVVFPAPLGPITPTISHSPTETLTSRLACTPPNRMDRSYASSTDIGDLHLLQAAIMQVEAVSAHPALDRANLLADAARKLDQVEQQEERPDDQRRIGGGQVD